MLNEPAPKRSYVQLQVLPTAMMDAGLVALRVVGSQGGKEVAGPVVGYKKKLLEETIEKLA
jgi:hypothetical protein